MNKAQTIVHDMIGKDYQYDQKTGKVYPCPLCTGYTSLQHQFRGDTQTPGVCAQCQLKGKDLHMSKQQIREAAEARKKYEASK